MIVKPTTAQKSAESNLRAFVCRKRARVRRGATGVRPPAFSAHADFPTRIFTRLGIGSSTADLPTLRLFAPAFPACGHVRLRWFPYAVFHPFSARGFVLSPLSDGFPYKGNGTPGRGAVLAGEERESVKLRPLYKGLWVIKRFRWRCPRRR